MPYIPMPKGRGFTALLVKNFPFYAIRYVSVLVISTFAMEEDGRLIWKRVQAQAHNPKQQRPSEAYQAEGWLLYSQTDL